MDYQGRLRLTADFSEADRELNRFISRIDRPNPVRIAIGNAGFERVNKSFAQLQKNIGDLNKTPLDILKGTGAGSRSDTFRQLSQEAKDFFNSIVSGNKSLASTTAGLRQQANAFRDLADNINFTDKSQKRFFRNFTQGAEIARTKAVKASIEQLNALQSLYQSGTTGLNQDISPRVGGLNQLLNLGKDLPRTKAALSEYRSELERVYDLVDTRSLTGGIIAVELKNVEKELLKIEQDRAEAVNQINGITKASYALTKNQLFLEEENLATIERQREARRRSQLEAIDFYNRSKSVSRDFGVNPAFTLRPAGVSDEEVIVRNLVSAQSKLNAIEEENLAAVERRIGARKQEVAIANELVKAQRQEAVDIYNRDKALSRNFGVNPAMALRPAGLSDEQVAKRNLIADRTAAAAEASTFNAVSRVAAEIENDLPILKSIERNRKKIEAETKREAIAEARNANQTNARGRSAELRRTRGLSFEERLASARPDLAPGAKSQKPFFRGDLRKAAGEGLIGGAFPLLFGQGLGASVGGFAGGFSGGMIGGSFGFGLSLAGTAVGQAVDNTARNLTALAASLKSPNDAIAALETSGFRVSDSIKFQVSQLQSVGRAYEAQTLVLQEVQKRLGPGSLTELRDLDAAQKRLQESWGAIGAEIQVRLLPVLQGFVEFLGFAADEINGFANQSRLQRLDPETFEKLRTQATRDAYGNRPGINFEPGDELRKRFNARLSELSRQELSKRFPNERAQVPLAPQNAFDAETTRIEQSRKIADQIQSAYREAFNLQRQAHDLQREGADLNKEIADYSYRKQREIFDLRQQAAEKEIENNRAAAQNRIERGDLNARQAFAGAVGFEQQLLGNVREVMRTRKEGEADIEQSRNKLELALARLNRDVEDYKRSNAREIEDIERRKLSYARSVEDYKMRVADYVRQRSMEAADFIRQAMRLPDAGAGGAVGGDSGLAAAVDRIGGAYQFRGVTAQGSKKPGDYQSDPRENFFFDRRPQLIAGAKNRISTLSKSDLAALAFTVLTEAGPTDIGKMDVAANLLIRSANLGNAPISAVATQPGQYVGVRGYSRNDLESEARGRQVFGSRYDQTLAMMRGGVGAGAGNIGGNGVIGLTGQTGIRSGPHLDARWADGRPITAAEVDRFVRVAGRTPSSFGVTSGYGPRRAPVPGASTFHKGIDFSTPAGQPITLTGGARFGGSIPEAQSGGGGIVGVINTPLGPLHLLHLERVIGGQQGAAAGQINSIPQPQFNATPIGATPSAAPINAERMAVLARMTGSEKEAQRILEEQVQLRQKGVELGQIEEILQTNQVPQLEQQYDTLTRQIEARRQNLALSDDAASAADIEAEGAARIAQIEKDRANALSKVQKQFGSDPKLIKQVNTQADLAVGIAKKEEAQRRKNLDLTNELQSADRVRAEVLRLQETLAAGKAESAALEAGRLEATNAELLQASTLYQQASQAQRDKLLALTTETEELRKQNEFRKQINQLAQETAATGAGLRAGFIGAPARAFEEELKRSNGNVGQATDMANRTKLLEDQQLIWNNLEKSIVDVSDAISGALTNGLVDIVGGARTIEDVGRDMLNSMAGSFADIAQQQLSNLMQRQLGSMLGGAGGPLTKMLGAGTEAAGAQALGTASAIAAGQVTMFGMALQTVAAQAGVSGALSGGGGNLFGALGSGLLGAFGSGLSGGFGSGILNASPNLFGDLFSTVPSFDFGGYYANGGVTKPGEGYVVGEKEPEFFFPGVSGRVVPRSDMEKAEALRQDSAEAEPIDVRYTVTEQRGERYVTEEQFRKGMADTTKRAQAMTYAGMRNNKQVRDFVSI